MAIKTSVSQSSSRPKHSLNHKGFYTLLLTGLLGLFLFVTYYATQQTQVYQGSAASPCLNANGQCVTGACPAGTNPSSLNCTQDNRRCCVPGGSGGGNPCTNAGGDCVSGSCPSGTNPSSLNCTQSSRRCCMPSSGGDDGCTRDGQCDPDKICNEAGNCRNCSSLNRNDCGDHSNRCEWNTSSGTCRLIGSGDRACPTGQHENTEGECVANCSTFTNTSACFATGYCAWDPEDNTCKGCAQSGLNCSLTCDQITEEATCTAEDCAWDPDAGTCAAPCDQLQDETSCSDAGERCLWDPDSALCGDAPIACEDQTGPTTCEDAGCEWDADNFICQEPGTGGTGDCSDSVTHWGPTTCENDPFCDWDSANAICVDAGSVGVTPGVTPGITPGVTPGVTPGPTGTGVVGTATFNLTVALQGITSSTGGSQSFKVTLSGGPNSINKTVTASLSSQSSGAFSGTAAFTSVEGGGGYKLLVKGPKHIQKKVCVLTPSETSPGTYRCGDGAITVTPNTTQTANFSGIRLLVGDLAPQDGIVDSYDIALVRNSFCTTSNPNACRNTPAADLNLDGIVDTQDYSLLISSLSVKYDEQ